MKVFRFPIYGTELNDYCFSLVDEYGENSPIIKLLDENYNNLIEGNAAFVDQLNAIRKFLCKNGFSEEVAKQDNIFLDEVSKRPRKKQTPLAERWKYDMYV